MDNWPHHNPNSDRSTDNTKNSREMVLLGGTLEKGFAWSKQIWQNNKSDSGKIDRGVIK